MRKYFLLFVIYAFQFAYTANAQQSIKLFGHIGSPTDTVAYWFNNNKSKLYYITGSKDENYAVTIKLKPKDSLINFTFHGIPFSCEQTLKTQQILSYLKHSTSMRYDLILVKDFCESTMECQFTDEQRELEYDWINADNQVLKLKECSNYQKEAIVAGTTYIEHGSWSINEDHLIQLKPAYAANKETGALTEASVATTLSIGDVLVSGDNVTYRKKTLTPEEFLKLLKKK